MVVAIANARMTAPAPTRHPRRFGLLSVAEVVDGGTPHWMLGGLRADAEDCSKPSIGTIGCAPSANKSSRSWYSDAIGDPWLTYMFETCKMVGRFSEAETRTKTRFLASEQSAVELGFQTNVLKNSTSIGAVLPSVAQAIGALEAKAAAEYGGEVTLHLPFVVAEEAVRENVVQRIDGHLETTTGTLVSVGNYQVDLDGGSTTAPVLYITGEVVLYRSDLTVSGPVFDRTTNDYFVLVERAYGALIDCFSMRATATLCGCAAAGTVGGQSGDGGGSILDEGSSMSASALGIACADSNPETAANLNDAGVVANPTGNWGTGNCASIDCGGDTDREVRWDGTTWVGC